jgi:uncharacterized membrane protein HdeD (DUF308 family)
MWPRDRWVLVAFGAAMIVFGVRLIVRPLPAGERPSDDSPGGRLLGGLVLIAFGIVVGAVGLDLMSRGK